MKQLEDISLTLNQHYALNELKRKFFNKFDIEAIVLYGSVARGEADEESDIDLLILTAQKLSRHSRHEITDVVFEVNLDHGTNFSTLVVDRDSWESGCFSILLLRDEILKDGVPL